MLRETGARQSTVAKQRPLPCSCESYGNIHDDLAISLKHQSTVDMIAVKWNIHDQREETLLGGKMIFQRTGIRPTFRMLGRLISIACIATAVCLAPLAISRNDESLLRLAGLYSIGGWYFWRSVSKAVKENSDPKNQASNVDSPVGKL